MSDGHVKVENAAARAMAGGAALRAAKKLNGHEEDCHVCHGTGKDHGKTCGHCHGTGHEPSH